MTSPADYRVLARKYRPQTFAELIGQEAMVRTLANALRTGRLAHAFVLTGVRGVGKTTTARIIAKGLNCIGPDGQGGPTTDPCGQCANCIAIAEGEHLDVQEMDAASRTGVDDVREIIEGVKYAPQMARYKIYIIDEVHMLSKNAFNALLKTLEEPPEQVKFLFATTEIRKVPVTILSRCQRFDLKRVSQDALVTHLSAILAQEGLSASDAALAMIARAAEGSVRDSLSLLDQAIAHATGDIDEAMVRDMLGLADKSRVIDLARAVFGGDSQAALAILGEQYDAGADPAVVLNDLAETVHWLTRLKVTPDAGSDMLVSEAERSQGTEMATSLAMSHLTRAWSMLLKGLGEVRDAPRPIQAAEMVLIRLCYAADLPSPSDLVRQVKEQGATASPAPSRPEAAPSQPPPRAAAVPLHPERKPDPISPVPKDFAGLVKLFEQRRAEAILISSLRHDIAPVRYEPGRLTLRPGPRMPRDLVHRLKQCLELWTGRDWLIDLDTESTARSLHEHEQDAEAAELAQAEEHPLVRAAKKAFPQGKLVRISRLDEPDQNMMPDVRDSDQEEAG